MPNPYEGIATPVEESVSNPYTGIATPVYDEVNPYEGIATPVESSAIGAVGRAAMKETVPTLAGIVAAGALTGGVALSELGPGALVGALAGGIIGGIAAGFGAQKLQDIGLETIMGEESFKAMQKQEAVDVEQHPWATLAGGLIPQAIVARPSISNLKTAAGFLGSAVKLGRIGSDDLKTFVATPEGRKSLMTTANVIFGAGTQASFSTYDAMTGGDTNVPRIMTRILAGAILTGDSPYHKSLTKHMLATPEGRSAIRETIIAENHNAIDDTFYSPAVEPGITPEEVAPRVTPEPQQAWMEKRIAYESSREYITKKAFEDVPDAELRNTLVSYNLPEKAVARMKRPEMIRFLSDPEGINHLQDALLGKHIGEPEMNEIIAAEEASRIQEPSFGDETEGAYAPAKPQEPPPLEPQNIPPPKEMPPESRLVYQQAKESVAKAAKEVADAIPVREATPLSVGESAGPDKAQEIADAAVAKAEAELDALAEAQQEVRTPKRPVGLRMTREQIKTGTREQLIEAIKKNNLGPATGSNNQMRSRLRQHMINNGQLRDLTPEQQARYAANLRKNKTMGAMRAEWESDADSARNAEMLMQKGLPEGTEVSIKGDEGFSSWRVRDVLTPSDNDIAKNRLQYLVRDDVTGNEREVYSDEIELAQPTQEVDNDVYGESENIHGAKEQVPQAGNEPRPSATESARRNEDLAAWKAAHGLTKTEQGEMFGKGAVGDRFVLKQEEASDNARIMREQESAAKAKEAADKAQGRLPIKTPEFKLSKEGKANLQDVLDMGYKDMAEFESDFKRNRNKQELETEDEYLKRRYCEGK